MILKNNEGKMFFSAVTSFRNFQEWKLIQL